MKNLITVIAIWMIAATSFAQVIKKFTDDLIIFPNEFNSYVNPNLSDENQDLLKKFIETWNTLPTFSEEEKHRIIKLSNLLIKNKAVPNPYFIDYIKILFIYKELPGREMDYIQWENGLADMLEKEISLTKLNSFLKLTQQLLKEKIIYKSFSTDWRITTEDYYFIFNGKKLIVDIKNTDLVCYAKRDSIKIENTRGIMDPIEHTWTGRTGKVTWERAHYDREQIYATLNNYRIDLTGSDYHADSVSFTNKLFFDKPLFGRLDDKVMEISDPQNSIFPEFESYSNEFKIKNLYQGVDFDGGFLFSGAKIIGRGNKQGKARLIFTRSDTTVLQASSNYFIIKKEVVRGLNTEVSIYVGKDSIYHPDLNFSYNATKRELLLLRTLDITSKAAYNNSYHKVNMNFGQLIWKIDEPLISMSYIKGDAIGQANFESMNYFTRERYERMMSAYDRDHPLVLVNKFAEKMKSDNYNALDLAKYLKIDLSQVRHFLMDLAAQSFIFFDTQTDDVRVLQRTKDYIRSYMGKIDYDVIDLHSTTNAPLENAFLDIRTMDMTINGMPKVMVSTVQNVAIFPENSQIIMKRNRNFQFNGVIRAGLFTFHGSNFFFHYDSFKINLQNVDSVEIAVATGVDNYGLPVYTPLRSIIEKVTGDLLIDKSSNKSGFRDYPEYPIFNSREYSYVYYDDPKIQKGKYPRNSFYFKLDPFTIDSLDNFSKEAMEFHGSLSSSGIFPEFRQTLKLRDDLSLGFIEKTPPEGYSLYSKGRFYNDIDLSNRGLHGKGKITWLEATLMSEDYLFYPDSMNSYATSFIENQTTSGVEYPWVNGRDIYIHWEPKKDKMFIDSRSAPIAIINNQNTITGRLTLEPTGLSGSGKMDLTTAEMTSKLYTYKSNSFNSDTADFKLRSLKSTGFTVLTNNVNAHIDYTKRQGVFRSNADFTLVQFPENKYISYLDYFTWLMDTKEFKMGVAKEYTTSARASYVLDTLEGPRYISVHPNQDSLNFVSPKATYDYLNNLLKADDVEYIRVADSRIYPHEGKVVIEQDAKMRTLENSKVLTNDTTNYHLFYASKINIGSRFKYSGEGDKDYIDEDGKKQKIHYHTINVNTARRTYAIASIVEPDSFMLNPHLYFQGEVRCRSEAEHMIFDGAVMIVTSCQGTATQWLAFETVIVPDSIYIPVSSEPKDIDNNNTYIGLMMGQDSIHIYPAFISGHRNYNDSYIFTADGYLYYNKYLDRYLITKPEKYQKYDTSGNYLRFDQSPCKLYGEGKIDLGVNLWQVKLNSYGNATYEFDSNRTTMNVTMAMDFHVPDNILKIFANHIDTLARQVGSGKITETYQKSIGEMIANQKVTGLTTRMVLYDSTDKWPAAIKHTLILNNARLKWNHTTKSYRSTGQFGIAAIGSTPVNMMVDGWIEVTRKRSGDMMDVFIEVDRNNWYYFGYNHGVMNMLSSNMGFNNAIGSLSAGKRKMKVKRGEMPYIFILSTNEKMQRFLSRFENETAADEETEDTEEKSEEVE